MPEQALAAGLQSWHAAAGLVMHHPQQLRPRKLVPLCLVHHPVQRWEQYLRKVCWYWVTCVLSYTAQLVRNASWPFHTNMHSSLLGTASIIRILDHSMQACIGSCASQKG